MKISRFLSGDGLRLNVCTKKFPGVLRGHYLRVQTHRGMFTAWIPYSWLIWPLIWIEKDMNCTIYCFFHFTVWRHNANFSGWKTNFRTSRDYGSIPGELFLHREWRINYLKIRMNLLLSNDKIFETSTLSSMFIFISLSFRRPWLFPQTSFGTPDILTFFGLEITPLQYQASLYSVDYLSTTDNSSKRFLSS